MGVVKGFFLYFMRAERILMVPMTLALYWNIRSWLYNCVKGMKICYSSPLECFQNIAREGMPALQRVTEKILDGRYEGQLGSSSVILSVFCQQCVIFGPQVFPAGECHPGGAQRHHCHSVQPLVWEDRGGEQGQHQQGKVQHSGMCGHGRGRAGIHALLYQR